MTCARFELGETIAEESMSKMKDALLEAGADFTRRAGRIGVTVSDQ